MRRHVLLDRQIARATAPGADLDFQKFYGLIAAAYEEKDLGRRRADAASHIVSEELEEALRELEMRNLQFKAALDNMKQGLCMFDADGRIVVCNRYFLDLCGWDEDEPPIGLRLADMLARSASFRELDAHESRRLIDAHMSLDPRAGGILEQVWSRGRIVAIKRNPVDDGTCLESIEDITCAREAADRIAHMARHDALTDLPNRIQMREALIQGVADAREGRSCAVFCLDLDRFKTVNDTLGHEIGDALLVEVAERLRSLKPENAMVARLGGDEFALVHRDAPDFETLEALAERIIDDLSVPYGVRGHFVDIGVTIGIEIIDSDLLDPDEALRNADFALYRAKSDGRGSWRRYDPSLHILALQRRLLEQDLRAALEKDQFEIHYQAQFDLKTQRVCGFEALLRWRHPVRGLILPNEFIPIAEEIGVIDEIGAFVLERACCEAVTWPDHLGIAVNLSAVQFKTRNLYSHVMHALRTSHLDPGRLELEITESVMLDEHAGVLDQLREIKRLRVRIALDDFGTGFSSLSYILKFPFDKLKIDKTFVDDLEENNDSRAIIRALISLCGSLGIASVAEGVETAAQFSLLADEQIDEIQGYLISRPVPLAETYPLMRDLGIETRQALMENCAA